MKYIGKTRAILLSGWAMALYGCVCAGSLFAQGSSPSNQVRALSNQILRIERQMAGASASEAALLRSQAAQILLEREAVLAALIETDTAEALKSAFPEEVAAGLVALFPESAARLERHGAWQGPLEYLIADMPDRSTHQSIRLMRAGQEQLEVHFAGPEPAGLKSGDILAVHGVRAGQKVAAAGGQIQGSEVAAATCSTFGDQKIVAILVSFPSFNLAGGVDQELLKGILWGNDYTTRESSPNWSVDDFWQQNSNGQARAPYSGGQVVGPYLLNRNYNENNTCDYQAIRNDAIAAADADVNFRDYSRVMIVMPNNSACNWAGLGSLGCWSNVAPQDGTFTASVAWQRSDQMSSRNLGVKLSTHELGHNLTMHHASSRDFGGEALGPLGAQGTLSEYGDTFSTMGSWNFGYYSAHHQQRQLGWFTKPNNYLDVETNGTFSIHAYETPGSVLKALRIRRGPGNNAWLWVEYRQNQGIYDSQLASQVFTGALIHYEDSITGSYTHLLDFTTGTASFNDPALAVGQTWQDPYSSLSLHVDNAANGMLTVSVSYGAVPCTESNPSVALSPPNQSGQPGSDLTYTVSVTNNDASGCSPATFDLSSTAPAGWGTDFSPSSLTIGPGLNATATMTKQVPESTAEGSYAIDATASRGSHSGTGTANATVTAPNPEIQASLSIPKTQYSTGETVEITATVTTVGAPVDGATVQFTMSQPSPGKKTSAKTATYVATTDQSGVAVWGYSLGKRDKPGDYAVDATASSGSQTVNANTVTFKVN